MLADHGFPGIVLKTLANDEDRFAVAIALGTWTCVGDPGCAHSGTAAADVDGAVGACACSGSDAVQSIRISSESNRLSARRSMKIPIAKTFSRPHTLPACRTPVVEFKIN